MYSLNLRYQDWRVKKVDALYLQYNLLSCISCNPLPHNKDRSDVEVKLVSFSALPLMCSAAPIWQVGHCFRNTDGS